MQIHKHVFHFFQGRVNVNSSNKTLIVIQSASSLEVQYQVNTVHQLWLGPSINDVNTESSSTGPAAVLRSVGSEHGPPAECNSSIRDVVVETGLCKDVGTTLPVVLPALVPPVSCSYSKLTSVSSGKQNVSSSSAVLSNHIKSTSIYRFKK